MVETKVIDGAMTSPPVMSSTINARCRAAVAEFIATAWGTSMYAAKHFSNSAVLGPSPIQKDLKTSSTASNSDSSYQSRKIGIRGKSCLFKVASGCVLMLTDANCFLYIFQYSFL